MNTQTVANRFFELCSTGKFHEAMQELYADNAKHVEAMEMPGMPQIVEGKQALLKMSEHWDRVNEVHSAECTQPMVNGDQFICNMTIDVTMGDGPMAGQRSEMSESCLYTVQDDKITEARFFYSADC